MDGGRSPDGHYEVRLARDANSDPSEYGIYVHTAKRKQPIFTLDGTGGYNRFEAAKERCYALWHRSSEFVVVTDQATRHSKEIYILSISGDRVERLQFPDYVQNALGRVNATEIDLHCVSSPKSWDGDDLLLNLYFSISNRDEGRLFYTCEVALHLWHGPNSASYVTIKSVSTPNPKTPNQAMQLTAPAVCPKLSMIPPSTCCDARSRRCS